MTVIKNNVKSILIPAFGVGTGGMGYEEAAEQMWMAYMQIMCGDSEISWKNPIETHFRALF